MSEWASARSCVTEVIANTKDRSFNRLMIPLKGSIDESIENACDKEAKSLQKREKINDAIKILKRGFEIVNNESSKMKDLLAILYCDCGDKKIRDRDFSSARKDFNNGFKN